MPKRKTFFNLVLMLAVSLAIITSISAIIFGALTILQVGALAALPALPLGIPLVVGGLAGITFIPPIIALVYGKNALKKIKFHRNPKNQFSDTTNRIAEKILQDLSENLLTETNDSITIDANFIQKIHEHPSMQNLCLNLLEKKLESQQKAYNTPPSLINEIKKITEQFLKKHHLDINTTKDKKILFCLPTKSDIHKTYDPIFYVLREKQQKIKTDAIQKIAKYIWNHYILDQTRISNIVQNRWKDISEQWGMNSQYDDKNMSHLKDYNDFIPLLAKIVDEIVNEHIKDKNQQQKKNIYRIYIYRGIINMLLKTQASKVLHKLSFGKLKDMQKSENIKKIFQNSLTTRKKSTLNHSLK